MTRGDKLSLKPNLTPGAQATQNEEGIWHLEIPAGPSKQYRLAQLDDYTGLQRRAFRWKTPFTLALQARTSHAAIPGTWGFGLWNDPFSISLGLAGATRRLPALPQAAWFFFASSSNYLSLRDDLPAHGALAATFRSSRLPAFLMALGVPAVPLFFYAPTARLMRRLGRRLVEQDAANLDLNPMLWHQYTIEWREDCVFFFVDDETVCETSVVPHAPLGVVLWVDNQYAALPPSGKLAFGTLPNPEPVWIEVKDIVIS